MRKDLGFTLVELMVVISIISLLSSIVLAGLHQARIQATDTSRVQELQSIQHGLELYYLDNGRYPSVRTGGITFSYAASNNTGTWTDFTSQLSPYIKLPANSEDVIYPYYYLNDLIQPTFTFCTSDSHGIRISFGPDGYLLRVTLEGTSTSYTLTGGRIIPCPY